MSYTSPVQLRFSNPNDYNCGSSERCGLPETDAASADNVKALSLTMPQIAALQGSVAPTTYSVSGVLTINGTATSGITLSVGGVSASSGTAVPSSVACQASGSTGVYSCSAPAGYTFTLTPNSPANTKVSWAPASATISAIGANQTANFTGFNEGRYQGRSIKCQIVPRHEQGSPDSRRQSYAFWGGSTCARYRRERG
jgi:hypothetical protein